MKCGWKGCGMWEEAGNGGKKGVSLTCLGGNKSYPLSHFKNLNPSYHSLTVSVINRLTR